MYKIMFLHQVIWNHCYLFLIISVTLTCLKNVLKWQLNVTWPALLNMTIIDTEDHPTHAMTQMPLLLKSHYIQPVSKIDLILFPIIFNNLYNRYEK